MKKTREEQGAKRWELKRKSIVWFLGRKKHSHVGQLQFSDSKDWEESSECVIWKEEGRQGDSVAKWRGSRGGPDNIPVEVKRDLEEKMVVEFLTWPFNKILEIA